MHRSGDRILTTHTGSLPRPPELTSFYVQRQRGEEVDTAEVDAKGREAVRDIVAKQVEAGIDVGNDGEQTRDGFFIYLTQRVTGLGGSWHRPQRGDAKRYPAFLKIRAQEMASKEAVNAREALPTAIGEVEYVTSEAIEKQCTAFADALKETGNPFVDTFMTAPSPGIIASAIRNRYYDSDEAYLAALGKALQVEYEAIVNHGFLLQVDCPDLALERHITYQDEPTSKFVGFVERVVDTINTALRNIPRDRVRLHVCWGNYEGPHDCDVPLHDILPAILQAKVGALVLPFANARHAHEYKVLRTLKLGDDQIIIAGVIDTLVNVIEHPEVIADRLENVVRVVGDPQRVMAGTDCGFDTSAGSGRVASDVVWAKLASLREGAKIASTRFF
jgi:5-methyltetrahydropteroyltriglutamate--homocysteine methyltransferase